MNADVLREGHKEKGRMETLALTSPTSGGRSIGIVRSRTQATEFYLVFLCILEK
jgi:hypothetical protein